MSASAEELKHAPTAFLGTNTDYAAIAMQCEGEPPYSKMTCSFTQTRIRQKDPATVEKERAELKANLEKMPEPELLKKFKPGPKELAQYTEYKQSVLAASRAKDYVTAKRLAVQRAFDSSDAMNTCKDKPCLIEALMRKSDDEQQTCSISSHNFSAEFKRIGPHKWVSNQGPQGMCNVVLVQTLEHESNEPILWTFTQSTVTGDTSEPFCKGLIENRPPVTYSW
ncbi:MAG: hypothetical protein ACREBU_15045, partial [Nitrososphaera sp.]